MNDKSLIFNGFCRFLQFLRVVIQIFYGELRFFLEVIPDLGLTNCVIRQSICESVLAALDIAAHRLTNPASAKG
jgi:hypothetical protein